MGRILGDIKMKVVQFNSQSKTKQWLMNILNDMKQNYKQMFNSHNKRYASLWEQYVEINYTLTTQGYKPIDIPDEMDFPLFEEYYISHLTENYTQWYKRTFNEFCNQMEVTIKTMEEYMKEMQ